MSKKKIDRESVCYLLNKTKIDVQINCVIGGYKKTFTKLEDFIRYLMKEEGKGILEAIDLGCDVEMVFRDEDGDASATIDKEGMLMIEVAKWMMRDVNGKSMNELVGKELKESKEKVR